MSDHIYHVIGVPRPDETPDEREARFRGNARLLLACTLTAIRDMGYTVAATHTNSDVDVKGLEVWLTLNKIK